jgi:AcrR family transcriptional regulator
VGSFGHLYNSIGQLIKSETTMARPAGAEAPSDTGERILEAALEAFSEKGFDGATTREIAARADVTLGLLQYHFGGKLKLWQAAVDRAFGEMRAGLDAVLADPAPADERERLRRLIRLHVEFVGANPEFIRIMHDEGKRRGPRMRWLADRHVQPLFDRILPLLERSRDATGWPADVPTVHFVYALVGAVGMIFHQAEECRRVAGIDPTDPAAIDAHARAIEHLFIH